MDSLFWWSAYALVSSSFFFLIGILLVWYSMWKDKEGYESSSWIYGGAFTCLGVLLFIVSGAFLFAGIISDMG